MAALRAGLASLRGCSQNCKAQWQQPLRRKFHARRVVVSSITTTKPAKITTQPRRRYHDSFEEFKRFSAHTSGPEGIPNRTGGISHARPVPTSPSYFSRRVTFTDNFLRIRDLFRTHQFLPAAPVDKQKKVVWKTLAEYKQSSGEPIPASEYSSCLAMVKHLHKIHPDLKPAALAEAMQPFLRQINPFENVPRTIPIDRFGRALGVGRRKTSTARAWVVEGTGEVQVNGKSLAEAFGRVHDRESATWALRVTDRMDKYNVWALVQGGGVTGQAEAMTLAVAKALIAHEPALKPALRRGGCVTRDRRMVERKKHGHVKARKMPAWVKR